VTPGTSYGRTALGDVVACRFHAGSYYHVKLLDALRSSWIGTLATTMLHYWMPGSPFRSNLNAAALTEWNGDSAGADSVRSTSAKWHARSEFRVTAKLRRRAGRGLAA
jgi:hypothetical protein